MSPSRWIRLFSPALLALPAGAQTDLFGSDCAGGTGTAPIVAVTGDPCSGCAFSVHVSGPPLSPGLLVVGASNTAWGVLPLPLDLGSLGLASCDLNVSVEKVLPVLTDESGEASLSATGWQAGVTVYLQVFVADPSPTTFGGLSEGLEVTATVGPPKPLNVLFIMSDQHSIRSMGCYENGFGGLTQSLTPNLDRIADEGVKLTQAFCASPQCVPSRFSLLSGRWPHNHGARWNSVWPPADQVVFPQLARQFGYETATIGKHHMFWLYQPEPLTVDLGFDHVVSLFEYEAHCQAAGQEMYITPGQFWQMSHLPEEFEEVGFTFNSNEFHPSGFWADQVIEFLDDRAGPDGDGKPFVCWYSMLGPHTPILPTGPADPQDWAHMYHPYEGLSLPPNVDKLASTTRLASKQANFTSVTDSQWKEVLSYYYGLTTQIDWNIGRVLDHLDQLGLWSDTLVIYTADHGEMAAEMRTWGKGTGSYDALTRVPLLMRLPGVIPAGHVVDEPVGGVDLFPTLAELTGVSVPDEVRAEVDGRSLVDLLIGAPTPEDWPECAFSEFGTPELAGIARHRAAHGNDAKYAFDELNGGEEEFYDLVLDPYELDDLFLDPDPAVQEAIALLRDELAQWWGDESTHAPIYATTGALLDPPVPASDPVPPDRSTDVARDVDPSWLPCTAAETQRVHLGTDPAALEWFTDLAAMESCFNPGTLAPSTTYSWRVDQVNANGVTSGDVWQFTTEAGGTGGPGLASDPVPAQHADGVATTAQLQWTPSPDATSQVLHLGAGDALSPIATLGQAVSAFDPGPLEAGAEYAWRVDQVDAEGTTVGTVWDFVTDPAGLPERAAAPFPPHLATSVDPAAVLSWSAGLDAKSHEVFLGTTFPLALQGNQAGTSFDPGALTPGQTCFWRIDEVNAAGTRLGWTWRFTVAGP